MHSRRHIHEPITRGQRLADDAANLIGSWRFLIGQSGFLFVWLIINTVAAWAWDKPPYILLNLLLSFQAAFTGPVLLIAANRSAQRDRLRDDHEAAEVEQLFTINQQQLEILQLLHTLAAQTPSQPSAEPKPLVTTPVKRTRSARTSRQPSP